MSTRAIEELAERLGISIGEIEEAVERNPDFPHDEVALYIQRLKSRLHVKTDEQLANALGMSKQNIANWRRRANVPEKIQRKTRDELGIRFGDHIYGFDSSVQMNVVNAVSLYVIVRYIEENGEPKSIDEWQKLGDTFHFFSDMVRGIVREKFYPIDDAKKLIAKLMSYENGRGLGYDAISDGMKADKALPNSGSSRIAR